MTLKTGETSYPLEESLRYTKNGQFEDAKTLLLREPKIQHVRRSLKLNQIIKKSELEAASTMKKLGFMDTEEGAIGLKAGGETPKIESMAKQWKEDSKQIVEQVTMQLEQSSTDMYKFAETFWKMADQEPSICLIDGETPMKAGHRERISPKDFIGVPIWWCSFFVTLSDSERRSMSEGPQDSA